MSDGATNNPDMAGRLAIPAIGPNGVYNLRFRSLDGREPKYLGLTGVSARLFNIRALHEADDVVCITEGELDAVILEGCGLHAVGCTGVSTWKRHHPRMFAGFSTVYIFGDGDQPGREFASRVAASVSAGRVITMDDKQDVTDLFLSQGKSGIFAAMGLDE